MFDEWLYAVCWSSLFIGVFILKKCVVFSLIFFGSLKYDFLIKKEMFHFLPIINYSVTIE